MPSGNVSTLSTLYAWHDATKSYDYRAVSVGRDGYDREGTQRARGLRCPPFARSESVSEGHSHEPRSSRSSQLTPAPPSPRSRTPSTSHIRIAIRLGDRFCAPKETHSHRQAERAGFEYEHKVGGVVLRGNVLARGFDLAPQCIDASVARAVKLVGRRTRPPNSSTLCIALFWLYRSLAVARLPSQSHTMFRSSQAL
ncbi:hypothetical protein MSAN_02492000 [Mycena sanguinolenta]|uniref:Uncharacterized protein n=1 Tax=Mycena sanguinolenta TaxID=230812 RepID=A0A8H6U1R6_9AGAR|nr:hypothetical protein MSAN_02492000 [Mycena sanguinolenta]